MPDLPLPPGVSGKPPIGASPISAPSGNPGSNANAMAKIREAVKILEQALPDLPTGSDPYKATLSAIQGISKHVSPADEVPGVQKTALRDLSQQADKSGMMQALQRSMGSLGGAGQGGGGAPGSPGGAPSPLPAGA